MRDAAIVEAEIRHLDRQIEQLEHGTLDAELFKKLRLQYGIYSMRRAPTAYMVRVKVRLGIVSPQQLDALTEICETLTPARACHLTTRQDVQLYGIERHRLAMLLRILAGVGLTTREASGNVVRNVTCCPWAGIAPDEPFDVTPYARAVSGYFLRNPLSQLMPRKIKMAFEGCPTDHARTPVHDIGVVAALQGGQRGFRIYAGGGLGPLPRAAQLLEPWTAAELLLPTVEAILRVFDRCGERRNRARARLKFLVEEMGWATFQKRVLEERWVLWAIQSGYALTALDLHEEPAPALSMSPLALAQQHVKAFAAWRSTNVIAQRQAAFASVIVRVPLGDLTASQLHGLAVVARQCAGGIRFTNDQNVLLRFVPQNALSRVYDHLKEFGLDEGGAGRLADVTRCPGADSCLSAMTHPRGLAEALERMAHEEPSRWADERLSVKISGCPNSCGHHHIADLGFFGMALKVGERPVPCYQILVGGRTAEGKAVFGKRLARVPARRAPEAVRRLLALYQGQKQPEESFAAFADRVGVEALARELAELADVSTVARQPELFVDLGETEPFVLEAGKGECAE